MNIIVMPQLPATPVEVTDLHVVVSTVNDPSEPMPLELVFIFAPIDQYSYLIYFRFQNDKEV